MHINRPIPEGYWNEIQEDFPNGKLISADQHYFPVDQLPETIQEALAQGRYAYAEEYYALKILYEEGNRLMPGDEGQSEPEKAPAQPDFLRI
ncbi:MAG: hypothetical protein ACLR23_12255 [Clostridia bacterium]